MNILIIKNRSKKLKNKIINTIRSYQNEIPHVKVQKIKKNFITEEPTYDYIIEKLINSFIINAPILNMKYKNDLFLKYFIHKNINNSYNKKLLIDNFASVLYLIAFSPCFLFYLRSEAYSKKSIYADNIYWNSIQKRLNLSLERIQIIKDIIRFYGIATFTKGIRKIAMSSFTLNEFSDFRWNRIAKALLLPEANLLLDYLKHKNCFSMEEKLININANSDVINIPGINSCYTKDKSKYINGELIDINKKHKRFNKKEGKYKWYKNYDKRYEKYAKKEFNFMSGCDEKTINEILKINKHLAFRLGHKRIFGINESLNGRLYGPLTYLKKIERDVICKAYNLIELDYTNFNLNCIYLHITREKYDGNIYNDILNRLKLPLEYRSMIKIFIISIISCNKKSTVMGVINDQLIKKGLYTQFKDLNITCKTIIDTIEKVCWEIKEYFYCDLSGELQNIESNIIVKIALEMIKDNIMPWLLHDGFIIPKEFKKKYEILKEKLLREEILKRGHTLDIAIEKNNLKRAMSYKDLKGRLEKIPSLERRLEEYYYKIYVEYPKRVIKHNDKMEDNLNDIEYYSDVINGIIKENTFSSDSFKKINNKKIYELREIIKKIILENKKEENLLNKATKKIEKNTRTYLQLEKEERKIEEFALIEKEEKEFALNYFKSEAYKKHIFKEKLKILDIRLKDSIENIKSALSFYCVNQNPTASREEEPSIFRSYVEERISIKVNNSNVKNNKFIRRYYLIRNLIRKYIRNIFLFLIVFREGFQISLQKSSFEGFS